MDFEDFSGDLDHMTLNEVKEELQKMYKTAESGKNKRNNELKNLDFCWNFIFQKRLKKYFLAENYKEKAALQIALCKLFSKN